MTFARRVVSLGLFVGLVVGGCHKKEPPMAVEDAGMPPPSVPTVTELAPLVEEAGVEDAAPEAAPKKYGGPAISPNQQKIAQCCNAMRVQAKALGQSPEAFQLNAGALYCDTIAKQVGPQGTAPEFAQIRAALKSVKLPAACQF